MDTNPGAADSLRVQAAAQSAAVAGSPHEAGDQAFVDSIAADWDDPGPEDTGKSAPAPTTA